MRADPWMEALDRKFESLRMLQQIQANVDSLRHVAFNARKQAEYDKWKVLAEYEHDLAALPVADTFAWFDPAQEAAWQAAQTVPTDVPLRELKSPSGAAGWWWFTRPLPVRTVSNENVPVSGLLWSFADPDTIRFSVYILAPPEDTGHQGVLPLPSTQWFWPIDDTIDQLIAGSRATYAKNYGPGGIYAGMDAGLKIGLDATIGAIEILSRFFFAACVWLDQKILDAPPGPVERHARKRAQKEFKLKEPPTVKIIALRHTERGHREGASQTADGGRTWNCQWVVSGHWRKQAYGPGRMGRRLVFIHPYVKGPDDKPLRNKPEKLYVVMK